MSPSKEPRAALFDLDKTLIRSNSGRLFMEYRRRRGEVSLFRMLEVGLWLLQYSWGRLDAERIARRLLTEYRGTAESQLTELCELWASNELIPLISPQARRVVEAHQKAGDLVAIVTSSTRYGASPVARHLGIDHLLCSELDVRDGLFTGEIIEPLCFSEGKVRRALKLLDAHSIPWSDATFYSDSITDLPLLVRVGRAVAINPDRLLRRQALKSGWAIEKW